MRCPYGIFHLMKYTVSSGVRTWLRLRTLVRALGVVLLAAVPLACGSNETPKVRLLVSAAASLTAAFTDLSRSFEETNPGIAVDLNFGGSSALREQIRNGAPVDVFVSADQNTMREVIAALSRLTDAPTSDAPALDAPATMAPSLTAFPIATNRMAIALPHNNPAHITGLADFADATRFIGLCAITVPCGVYARHVLANAGVTPSIDTNEPDVTSLATKIALGEIDAGIVYTTDIAAHASQLDAMAIPDTLNVIATYPIVILKPSPAATRFVAFVQSDAGRAIFVRHGFGVP